MSQFESQFEQDLYSARLDKLEQIAALARATDPSLAEAEAKYPNHFRFFPEGTSVPALKQLYDSADAPTTAEQLEADPPAVAIAGRLVAIRLQGKAGFAQLQQGGQRLQIYVRKDDVGDDVFSLYKLLDLGDHIGVRGHLMRTRTGELTLKLSPVTLPTDAIPATDETPAVRVAPVRVAAITFLTKALLPLPDKYAGLGDIELRYRRRYLDLFTDSGEVAETPPNLGAPRLDSETWVEPPQLPAEAAPTRLPARVVFEKRAAILRSIRGFFDSRGYLEVETPMLHTISGGAAARPFATHHNALDIPLKLRIAPELYLKRLVVGGFDRVYEINRNFRNEGVSTQHNPEFTMLEFYQAYSNYHDLMNLTQELISTVAQEVNGTTITNFNGHEIDLSNWQKLSMREAIIKFWPSEAGSAPTQEDCQSAAKLVPAVDRLQSYLSRIAGPLMHWSDNEPDTEVPSNLISSHRRMILKSLQAAANISMDLRSRSSHPGREVAALFELLGEQLKPNLIQPTIIYDFPLAVSPLSKVKPNEPDWVERFEFYIGGFEVGNAFSELNDPDDQRTRFEAQLEERARGDDEAMAEVDEDYVRALGYGLPPTAGEGIGIDRLTMILTGSRSIRDVILFPLMRPHTKTTE